MTAEAETSNDGKPYDCNSKSHVTKQNDSVGKVQDWINTNVAKLVEQENRKFPLIRSPSGCILNQFWNIIVNFQLYLISVKRITNKIKDVFDDLTSHLTISSSPILPELILRSPSPNITERNTMCTPSPDIPYQVSLSDDEIKAGILASMTLDQKLGLLQKRQRLMDRMR